MKLTFSADIEAADSERRIISGVIVPFGSTGLTSAGPVVFEKGSIKIDSAKPVKLLREHNPADIVGKSISFSEADTHIFASFKIAPTQMGNDILTEAAEGYRDAMSVGVSVEASEPRDGVLYVTAATLREVSVVGSPAFAEAQITDVAASTPDEATTETTNEPLEGEAMANETTVEVVETAPAVVEASAPATPIVGGTYAKPRIDGLTAGHIIKHQFNATHYGNEDSRQVLAALAHSTTSENAGVVPVPHLREVIGVIDRNTPFLDSIERRPLQAMGTSFLIPTLGTQATVTETAEGTQPSSTDTTITTKTGYVKKFSGANVVSVELLERSDPSYLTILIEELSAAYARAVDLEALNTAWTGAGASGGTGFVAAIADGIADSYNVMKFTPDRLVTSPAGFAALLSAVGGDGRPLFNATGTQVNGAGQMNYGITGTVMGLQLVVDPQLSGTQYAVYPSAAVAHYSTPGSPVQVRTTQVSTMEYEIGVYGFSSTVAKYPTAVRVLTVS
jgi:HK97 family phage major capsid protein